jgi:predicted peptidase
MSPLLKNKFLSEPKAMNAKFCILIFILLLSLLTSAKAQEVVAYKAALHISGNDTLPYRILYPHNFDSSRQYPLVLFLHGAGERGNDNLAQLMHGSRLFAREDVQEQFPAVILFPQCPTNSFWSNVKTTRDTMPYSFDFQTGGPPTAAMRLLLELLDEHKKEPYIDQRRLYVGGLSMGGMGALELLRRQPDTFAAAFTICGGDHPENASKYANKVSTWLFHGEADPVVPARYSINMAEELRKLAADVKLTTYPGVGHSSWEQAFAEPDLLPWLFSRQKGEKVTNVKHRK